MFASKISLSFLIRVCVITPQLASEYSLYICDDQFYGINLIRTRDAQIVTKHNFYMVRARPEKKQITLDQMS